MSWYADGMDEVRWLGRSVRKGNLQTAVRKTSLLITLKKKIDNRAMENFPSGRLHRWGKSPWELRQFRIKRRRRYDLCCGRVCIGSICRKVQNLSLHWSGGGNWWWWPWGIIHGKRQDGFWTGPSNIHLQGKWRVFLSLLLRPFTGGGTARREEQFVFLCNLDKWHIV